MSRARRCAAFALLLIAQAVRAQAPDLPAIMLATGEIVTGPGGQVMAGDKVLAIQPGKADAVASANVQQGGVFVVEIVKTRAFRNTELSLVLEREGKRLTLLDQGQPVAFQFNGEMLPVRRHFRVSVGSGAGAAKPTIVKTKVGGIECPEALAHMDVNGDGYCDEDDLKALGAHLERATGYDRRMDVNGDGAVNTRDLVDMARAFRRMGAAK